MGNKKNGDINISDFFKVFLSLKSSELTLENYGHRLLINSKTDKIWISTLANGFNFEDASGIAETYHLNLLITAGKLNQNGVLEIPQDSDGNDLEDRVVKLKQTIEGII